jgi:hypothetical protein
MEKATGVVSKATKNIESSVETAKKALGLLGVGIGVGFFATLIKGSIDAQDRLLDLSKTTGILVEDLAGLKLAAKQSGGDLNSIAESINKLSVNMGKDSEKFRQLGVTAKDPLEAFKQLADIYTKLQDPQQRAAVMAQALGKAWAGAAPLLSEGSAKIQELVDKGKALSGVTKESAEQADKFNDQMTELNATLEGTRMKAIGPLLPQMNEVAKAMGEAAREGGLLLAVWVALGGLFATIFNLNLPKAMQIQKELIDLTGEAEKLSRSIQFMNSSVSPGARERQQDQLAMINARIELLKNEQRLLQEPPKPAVGGDKATEEAAAKFLGGDKEKGDSFLAKQLQEGMDEEAKIMAEASQLSDDFRARERDEEEKQTQFLIDLKNAEAEEERRLQLENAQIMDDFRAKERARDAAQKEEMFGQAHTFFGSLSKLMDTESKKQFKIGKAAAQAETAINTYKAAMAAYGALAGIPYVGPALGAAAAAAVIIAGAAQISNIGSTQIGGGQGVGTFPINPTTQQPIGTPGGDVGNRGGQTTIINMPPGQFFDRKTVRGLLEGLNEESNDGSRIIVNER